MVQLQRTSSNLLEPLQCREIKVCRGLSHEFGVVRLYRTFPNRIFTRGTRCVGYLYATSGWFNCSEHLRTFSNHFSAEGGVVCRGLSHEFGVVRLYRTFSNRLFTGGTGCVGYLCATSGWFNRSEPPRTFSNHFSEEKARCVEVFRMSSGWFDYTEPSRTAGEQSV